MVRAKGRRAPVAGLLEALEQLVEQHHLAAGEDDAVHGAAVHLLAAELLLRRLEQERVVAAPAGIKAQGLGLQGLALVPQEVLRWPPRPVNGEAHLLQPCPVQCFRSEGVPTPREPP